MRNYDALVAVAADNHGVLRTKDATAAGVGSSILNRFLLDGRLERLAHGLYRVTALPEDRLTPYTEATMWANGEGVISHASALEMQELCDILPRRIHITVPQTYNPRRAGGDRYQIHRYTLPPGDLTHYEGVSVVTAYRAIRQALNDGEDPAQLRLAVRSASRRGLLSRSEAARLWARLR